MSVSKCNELLQDLYARLTGRWYNTGKYKGCKFTTEDVKQQIREILKEYESEQV